MARNTKILPPELRLGALAIRLGFITKSQLEEAVAFQEKRGMQEYLGSVLLMLDYLTPKTLARVLAEQKKAIERHANVPELPTSPAGQKQFGRLAVELGLVTEAQLQEALRVQSASAPKPFLGAVLLDLGYLGGEAIPRILAAQFAERATAPPASPAARDKTAPLKAPPTPASPPAAVRKLADGPSRPPAAPTAPLKGAGMEAAARPAPPSSPRELVPLPVPKPVPIPVPRPVARPDPAAARPALKPQAPESLQVGHIAVRLGYMTIAELNEALEIQRRRTPKPFLGSLLVELGRLTSKTLARVLAEQVALMAQASKVQAVPKGRSEEGRFGRIAVACEFITQAQLDEALGIQGRSRPKPFLGAVLVDLGYLSPRQLSKVLAAQAAGEGFNST